MIKKTNIVLVLLLVVFSAYARFPEAIKLRTLLTEVTDGELNVFVSKYIEQGGPTREFLENRVLLDDEGYQVTTNLSSMHCIDAGAGAGESNSVFDVICRPVNGNLKYSIRGEKFCLWMAYVCKGRGMFSGKACKVSFRSILSHSRALPTI